jgi:3-oxoacyl-[acyl-carrier-protein] synthase-3
MFLRYASYELPDGRRPASEFSPTGADTAKAYQLFLEQSGLVDILSKSEHPPREVFERLVSRAIESKELQPERLRYVLFSGSAALFDEEICVPYYLLEHFGFHDARVLLLHQECTSTLQGLELARRLLASDPGQVLLLAISSGHDDNRFTGSSLLADGAGMLIADSEFGDVEVCEMASIYSGESSVDVIEGGAGKRHPMRTLKLGAQVIEKVLKLANLTIEDIAAVIPQNINAFNTVLLSRLLKAPEDLMFRDNQCNGGHLLEVDTIRNVSDFLDRSHSVSRPFVIYGSSFLSQGTALDHNHWAALCRRVPQP